MNTTISSLHRGLLWLMVLSGTIFGLTYYLIPYRITTLLGLEALDLLAVRTIGGFLFSSAVAAFIALRSGEWLEVRIVTIYLMVWNILNSLVIAYFVFWGERSLSMLQNAIVPAIIGLGLGYVLWKHGKS